MLYHCRVFRNSIYDKKVPKDLEEFLFDIEAANLPEAINRADRKCTSIEIMCVSKLIQKVEMKIYDTWVPLSNIIIYH